LCPAFAVPDHINLDGKPTFYPGNYERGSKQGGNPFGKYPPLPYLLKATAMAPRNAKCHEALGRAYLKLKQLKNAQADLEESVRLVPNSSSVRFELAMTYREQGLKEQSR
jgi:tetratricopeptide (TPR) repeat protein